MMNDFIDRLHEYTANLGLEFPIFIGQLETEDSISVYSLPGGKTIKKYYDGTIDKQLNYEFSIKTKDQEKGIKTLTVLAEALEHTIDIPSNNNSYDFQKIIIGSEPFFIGGDNQGFFFYRLTIQVELTIYNNKGDNK